MTKMRKAHLVWCLKSPSFWKHCSSTEVITWHKPQPTDYFSGIKENPSHVFYHMGVSENRGTPKSSILIGISIINNPFWGTTIFGNTYIAPSLIPPKHQSALSRWFPQSTSMAQHNRSSIPCHLSISLVSQWTTKWSAEKWHSQDIFLERTLTWLQWCMSLAMYGILIQNFFISGYLW